jgi:mono/diheme cytochrome c family protein
LIDPIASAALCRNTVGGARFTPATRPAIAGNPAASRRLSMPRSFRLALLAAGLALAVVPLAVAQQTVKREPIQPITDVSGAGTYRAYCAVCHGVAGKGDGPAASALTKPPADLTQIAKRNGGKFQPLSVRMTISGDTVVAAHGTRDMPTWGPLFHTVEGDTTAALRLRNLVGYLEGLQQK